MAWIESHEEIGDHKKTLWLTEILGCGVPEAVGYVHLLWHYTLKVAWKNGDLSDFIPPAIERACWWDGESGALVKAFKESGYMDGMKVHGWKEYAKHIIYQRLYNERRRKESTPFPQSHYSRNADVKTVATVPYRTVPDLTKNKKNIFVAPTPQEVTAYGASIGFRIDGEKFCAHYATRGWVPKGSTRQMKDWRSAVVTWKKNADPSAMMLPPKPRVPDPKPEDCIGPEEIKQLAAVVARGKQMP